jgi:hypothetical protein
MRPRAATDILLYRDQRSDYSKAPFEVIQKFEWQFAFKLQL